MKISDKFVNHKGDLGIKVGSNKNIYKFCALCCFLVRDATKLNSHSRGVHGGQCGGLLSYKGALPLQANLCYENFEAYLAEPE